MKKHAVWQEQGLWLGLSVSLSTDYSSLCHLQILLKAMSYKEEAKCENISQTPLSSVGQSSFNRAGGKVEILFGNYGWCVLQTKEDRAVRLAINDRFKNLHLWWHEGGLMPMEMGACTSGKDKKKKSQLKGIWRFKSNKSSHSDSIFREGLASIWTIPNCLPDIFPQFQHLKFSMF